MPDSFRQFDLVARLEADTQASNTGVSAFLEGSVQREGLKATGERIVSI